MVLATLTMDVTPQTTRSVLAQRGGNNKFVSDNNYVLSDNLTIFKPSHLHISNQ